LLWREGDNVDKWDSTETVQKAIAAGCDRIVLLSLIHAETAAARGQTEAAYRAELRRNATSAYGAGLTLDALVNFLKGCGCWPNRWGRAWPTPAGFAEACAGLSWQKKRDMFGVVGLAEEAACGGRTEAEFVRDLRANYAGLIALEEVYSNARRELKRRGYWPWTD
jgi:hypothetical protein